ncbi:MAG: hypothetical protein M1835_007699 [Candelina submexicana]|nr:MAG: hypothetical protein M1835_007699 [Candelina submexicana]
MAQPAATRATLHSTHGVPEYYVQPAVPTLSAKVKNFDDREVFPRYATRAKAADSRNFVIDFGKDEAWAAFDLQLEEWLALLHKERPASLNTRWVNIWAPDKQKDVVKALAAHYGLSPRLHALMCSEPLKPVHTRSFAKSRFQEFRQSLQHPHHKAITEDSDDVEEQIEMQGVESSTAARTGLDLNHYRIVDEVWHYNSVDWGDKYLCLGYNSLHNVKIGKDPTFSSDSRKRDLPHGIRLWTWLMLCYDGMLSKILSSQWLALNMSIGTVITVNEDPFPMQCPPPTNQGEAIVGIRRNMLNVFNQLSKVNHTEASENPLSILPIRRTVQSTHTVEAKSTGSSQSRDAPSLLFYYLFDDWYTTLSIVTRTEHKYAAELGKLRDLFLDKPALEHIEELHHVGRQLAVLKRMYQSYETIIERILERKRIADHGSATSTRFRGANPLIPGKSDGGKGDHHSPVLKVDTTEEMSGLRAAISPAAIVRFERLKDRISLYALNEIQDCLDEKESLTIMNFNLIGIKESQYVERLTRITILLAKVTILFLPVLHPNLAGDFTNKAKEKEGQIVLALSIAFLALVGVLIFDSGDTLQVGSFWGLAWGFVSIKGDQASSKFANSPSVMNYLMESASSSEAEDWRIKLLPLRSKAAVVASHLGTIKGQQTSHYI